jgi:aminoglycoside 3-N-acetyltransferase
MLGCGLGPNTTMHALEECASHPCISSGGTHLFTLRDAEGNTIRKEYTMHAYPGYAQRYERVTNLPHAAFLRQGRVLQATTFVLDAPGLRAAVLGKLQVDPFFFFQAHAQG